MTIKPGDRLPDAKFTVMGADGPTAKTINDVFSGKKVALFAVPGAYTPTCHKNHMPGFVDRVDEFKAKGIDTVACTAVNDIFVLTNWANDSGAAGKIEMLADGSGDFAKGHRPRHRSFGLRSGAALQTLCDARRRWRGQSPQRRGQSTCRGQIQRGQSVLDDRPIILDRLPARRA